MEPDTEQKEGVAELFHKTRELTELLDNAEGSKLFQALEKRAKQKSLALLGLPFLDSNNDSSSFSSRKHGGALNPFSAYTKPKRQPLTRVNSNLFETFKRKTLKASRLRHRRVLWLVIIAQTARFHTLYQTFQAAKVERSQESAAGKLQRLWQVYKRRLQRRGVSRAKRIWKMAIAAVLFINDLRTRRLARLRAAPIILDFLFAVRRSTPKKLIQRYHRRIRSAQRLWREYRFCTAARMATLTPMWQRAERDIRSHATQHSWKESIPLLYRSVTAGKVNVVATFSSEEHKWRSMQALVHRWFRRDIRKSSASNTDLAGEVSRLTSHIRKSMPAPQGIDYVVAYATQIIQACAGLLKPDMLLARHKETHEKLNLGLIPPILPKPVRALILRYYLSFKRLEYKRGLVLRSTENQENRVKRELEMNEDDVRVLLKVSVPQGSALMEDMFRKAMLPSKAPPVKPMELLRRVKKEELLAVAEACSSTLQHHYQQQVRSITSDHNRSAILESVSNNLTVAHSESIRLQRLERSFRVGSSAVFDPAQLASTSGKFTVRFSSPEDGEVITLDEDADINRHLGLEEGLSHNDKEEGEELKEDEDASDSESRAVWSTADGSDREDSGSAEGPRVPQRTSFGPVMTTEEEGTGGVISKSVCGKEGAASAVKDKETRAPSSSTPQAPHSRARNTTAKKERDKPNFSRRKRHRKKQRPSTALPSTQYKESDFVKAFRNKMAELQARLQPRPSSALLRSVSVKSRTGRGNLRGPRVKLGNFMAGYPQQVSSFHQAISPIRVGGTVSTPPHRAASTLPPPKQPAFISKTVPREARKKRVEVVLPPEEVGLHTYRYKTPRALRG